MLFRSNNFEAAWTILVFSIIRRLRPKRKECNSNLTFPLGYFVKFLLLFLKPFYEKNRKQVQSVCAFNKRAGYPCCS